MSIVNVSLLKGMAWWVLGILSLSLPLRRNFLYCTDAAEAFDAVLHSIGPPSLSCRSPPKRTMGLAEGFFYLVWLGNPRCWAPFPPCFPLSVSVPSFGVPCQCPLFYCLLWAICPSRGLAKFPPVLRENTDFFFLLWWSFLITPP